MTQEQINVKVLETYLDFFNYGQKELTLKHRFTNGALVQETSKYLALTPRCIFVALIEKQSNTIYDFSHLIEQRYGIPFTFYIPFISEFESKYGEAFGLCKEHYKYKPI